MPDPAADERPADLPAAARRAPAPVTLHQVAELAGVSTITVSRALREPAKLSGDTLARVRAAVARTGYVPNRAAGTLRLARSGFVAALVPTLQASQFTGLAAAFTQTLDAHGYQVLVGEIGYAPPREDELLRAVLGRRPDGLLVTGVTHSPEGRMLLQQAGIPVVQAWDLIDDPIDMLVGASHDGIGEAACRYLAQLGHRRLAHLSGDDERAVRRGRAFVRTALGLGLDEPLVLFTGAPATHAEGRTALARVLAERPDIDAVCCGSDMLAMGVLTEARARGLDVPGRLAVMGGGDADFAATLVPSLTSIRIDGHETGRQAAELLLARLQGRPVERTTVDVGFTVIGRESA